MENIETISTLRTFAEVDLAKLYRNTWKVRQSLYQDTQLLSVLKADGYGHGGVVCARKIESLTDWFAVATLEEAVSLRDGGIIKPILVFGYVPIDSLDLVEEKDITITGLSFNYIREAAHYCFKNSLNIKLHIKIDTGFHRLGQIFTENYQDKELQDLLKLYSLKGIVITGIYTHFASAGKDTDFTKKQYDIFNSLCQDLQIRGVEVGLRHCCNSKAAIHEMEMSMDMVRVGLSLYGLGAAADLEQLSLEPVLQWRARIILIKKIQLGDAVGYGRTFTAAKDMRIGIVSLGFADGYPRNLYNNSDVYLLFHGQRVRIIGKICMDMLMVDLSDFADFGNNEYVTILGNEGSASITADQIGVWTGGTAVEITGGINERVPRVYI